MKAFYEKLKISFSAKFSLGHRCTAGEKQRYPLHSRRQRHSLLEWRLGWPISKKYKFPEKSVDKSASPLYNIKAVREQPNTFAAIAQPVERILGKDEVASSNLASSSKDSQANWPGSFLFIHHKNWRPHPPNCQRQFIFSKRGRKASSGPRPAGNRVASSNLASSSKDSQANRLGSFLFIHRKNWRPHPPNCQGQFIFSKRGRKASSGPKPAGNRVASSNLASSSKASGIFGFQRLSFAFNAFFGRKPWISLFWRIWLDRIPFCHF